MSEHPRIGVFLCQCAGDISGRIDLEHLRARLQTHPLVPVVYLSSFWCSRDGLTELRRQISEENLERVVIAGCSARTHGKLLGAAVEAAGLNPGFCHIVNLREHVARVHPGDRSGATGKATRLVFMGLLAALRAEPIEIVEVPVEPAAAVVGAGISGITAALSLSRRGIPVHLFESEDRPGGLLRNLARIYPRHEDAETFLASRVRALEAAGNVEIRLGARVTGLRGHAGQFEVAFETGGAPSAVKAGAVILATGAEEIRPTDLERAGTAVTLTGFHDLLRRDAVEAGRIVFVLSADGPLSRLPTSIALFARSVIECVMNLQDRSPSASVTVLFQDLPADLRGPAGDLHRAGVRFLRYRHDDPPLFTPGSLVVREREGEKHRIAFDLAVFATALGPSSATRALGEIPLLWQDDHGFLLEPHLRLRPEESLDRGLYVAGAAHGPLDIAGCVSQAFGAAAGALRLLRTGRIVKRAPVAAVNEEICRGCGQCVDVCPFGAPRLEERGAGPRRSVIDAVLCVGCGFCVSECISGAIRFAGLTDRQVRAMVEGAAAR